MDENQSAENNSDASSQADELLAMQGNEFQAAFGEGVDAALDIESWQDGDNLGAMYESLERQVAEAVEQGGRIRERVRDELFPLVFKHPQAPENAGCFKVDVADLEQIHRGLLFNGGGAAGEW